jgi:hypothetical protein
MFRQATRGDGDISFGTLSKGFRDGFLLGAATGLLAGSAIDPASGLILAAAAWHGGILAGAIAGTVDAANSDCDCIVNIIDLPSPEPSLP